MIPSFHRSAVLAAAGLLSVLVAGCKGEAEDEAAPRTPDAPASAVEGGGAETTASLRTVVLDVEGMT